jgi:3-oxoadipate enol-lactonase
MPTLEVDGARLAYAIEGAGPDLVLVHAGVADMRMWEPLVERLADRFRTVRFDMRGSGATTYEPVECSDAGDVAALMDGLGIERAIVAGASFGGKVALELAATHPERVERLVLMDPPLPDHDWSELMRAFWAAEAVALEAGDIDEAVRLGVELWVGGASPAVQALVADMQARSFALQLALEPAAVELDPPVSERLAGIDVPVTVIVGEQDVADFIEIAQRLARELPSATLHRVAGAGHLPALERPDAVAELIVSRR